VISIEALRRQQAAALQGAFGAGCKTHAALGETPALRKIHLAPLHIPEIAELQITAFGVALEINPFPWQLYLYGHAKYLQVIYTPMQKTNANAARYFWSGGGSSPVIPSPASLIAIIFIMMASCALAHGTYAVRCCGA
jgi:hypothetical protein